MIARSKSVALAAVALAAISAVFTTQFSVTGEVARAKSPVPPVDEHDFSRTAPGPTVKVQVRTAQPIRHYTVMGAMEYTPGAPGLQYDGTVKQTDSIGSP